MGRLGKSSIAASFLGPKNEEPGHMISNGILEGLNSLIEAANVKARGYRTFGNFKIIAYIITGGLDFRKVNPGSDIMGTD